MARARSSTAVAVKDESTEVAVGGLSPEELAALQSQQEQEIDNDLLTTPILKIGQPLTREVQNEQAEAGEFINTLTGEGIGTEIEFIVAWYQKGRFAVDRDSNRAFVAFDKLIPDAWGDLVGEEFVGTPFDEYPEAEEVYKDRVNRKEIAWGRGPLVDTSHNFTGLAIVSGVEGEEDDYQPVRLSLRRTNVAAAKKILTLKRSDAKWRNGAFWDAALTFSTEKKSWDKGMSYNLVPPKIARQTTAEERAMAVDLAQAVAAGHVVDNSTEDATGDKPVEPDSKGGLAV